MKYNSLKSVYYEKWAKHNAYKGGDDEVVNDTGIYIYIYIMRQARADKKVGNSTNFIK